MFFSMLNFEAPENEKSHFQSEAYLHVHCQILDGLGGKPKEKLNEGEISSRPDLVCCWAVGLFCTDTWL